LSYKKWGEAKDQELEALEENHNWKITTFPEERKAIGCKWVYKTKFNLDGIVNKHKSRLVI